MDASDEFRFISPGRRRSNAATTWTTKAEASSLGPLILKSEDLVKVCDGNNLMMVENGGESWDEDEEPPPQEGALQETSSSPSLDRSVPVRVTSSNRNVKLRFMWDKAFKLFGTQRTVYRALSGINYQDCNKREDCGSDDFVGTGGGTLATCTSRRTKCGIAAAGRRRSGPALLLNRRSMSHSNLYFNGPSCGDGEGRIPSAPGRKWAGGENGSKCTQGEGNGIGEQVKSEDANLSKARGGIEDPKWATAAAEDGISGGEKPAQANRDNEYYQVESRTRREDILLLGRERRRGDDDDEHHMRKKKASTTTGTLDVVGFGGGSNCECCRTGDWKEEQQEGLELRNNNNSTTRDCHCRDGNKIVVGRAGRLQKAVQVRRTQSARVGCGSGKRAVRSRPAETESSEEHVYDEIDVVGRVLLLNRSKSYKSVAAASSASEEAYQEAGDSLKTLDWKSCSKDFKSALANSCYGSRETSPYPPQEEPGKVYEYSEPYSTVNGLRTRVLLNNSQEDDKDYCICGGVEVEQVSGGGGGNDSGLDTWNRPSESKSVDIINRDYNYKAPRRHSQVRKCGLSVVDIEEEKKKNEESVVDLADTCSIVCTISQKIPTLSLTFARKTVADGQQEKEPKVTEKDADELVLLECGDLIRKGKMKPGAKGGTTVVLISNNNNSNSTCSDKEKAVKMDHKKTNQREKSAAESTTNGHQELQSTGTLRSCSPSEGLFLSDFECMSEIDLNSNNSCCSSSGDEEQEDFLEKIRNNKSEIVSDKLSKMKLLREGGMKAGGFRPAVGVTPSTGGPAAPAPPPPLTRRMLLMGTDGLVDERFLVFQPASGGGDNELDSLDLTLFETKAGGGGATILGHSSNKDKSFMEAVEELGGMEKMMMDDTESHVYDTVRSVAGSVYGNWSDAGNEFEFMPAQQQQPGCGQKNYRDIALGHSPRGNHPDVDWEPYFCVLNQLDQTLTAYRSEEMSIFPGTPTRPRTTPVFGEVGLSPTEIPRVRLDGGPNSVKCLINNSKWGMNPVLEEEEEGGPSCPGTEKHHVKSDAAGGGGGPFQNMFRNSSPAACSPHDTSYDKACGSEQQRRSSAPLTPLLGGRETPSRFANFFSKRSFKSNPLKRTKSVTKLERKKPIGLEPESNNMLYPSRLRTSRSHESLLAWTTNPHAVNSVVNAGMMTTVDLTAGDVGVRPLHPSILGQHYAFQVITPSGSKYMSCSSAAERNAWVHAIRQAIKPHQDEMRRQENSLKIWILEAKGVSGGSSGKSSSKRYFCELYLDDVLYARTCGKQRGEMLFWGEHFEFTQLANVQLITVVFFREGDKKRKKERNTCIGKVKIPVNTVNSRSLIEKWYPVVADAGSNGSSSSQTTLTSSSSTKDKDGPSLRIKCKFQSVDILPLRCYKTFLQYVKDEFGPVCESLENVLSVKAKEELANAMVHVLHHEGLAKEFIAELALQEILKSGDEKLTFRGNSIATKAMEAFLKLVGSEYLHATLGPFIEQFQNAEDVHDCEIDPMKLPQTSSGTLRKNQEHLRTAVDIVWKSILHSHSGMFPIELRDCFVHCREALKSAGKEELSDHLISASIFLRFFCPAILSPSLFNITNEYPSEKSARNLTLVAKVLQTLANFTRFQGKESYMEFINDFVEKEAPNMKAFLLQISSPLTAEAAKKLTVENQGKVPAGGFIDLGKYSSMLSTLLAESVPKIAPKNDRFKQLQDIVEHIHWLLKQPGNVTSASPFPFPHVASPPPNVPPPPAPAVGLNLNLPGGNGHHHHPQHRLASSTASSPTNPVALNHQYQIPHQNINGGGFNNGGNVSCSSSKSAPQPIYAVSGGVIHNTQNPNVKNISQMHPIPHHPLQLQIPNSTPSGNNNNVSGGRSGSQASSGYQSQSPVLEGSDDKSKKNTNSINSSAPTTDHYINIQRGSHGLLRGSGAVMEESTAFRNSPSRKCNSQSVDDLSSLAVDNSGFKKRLTRSSSSSDCDCQAEYMPNKSSKARNGQHKIYSPSNSSAAVGTKVGKKIVATPHHRLNRRSSAELLKKNHPYSTSTDEDSDSCCLNISERSDASGAAPQLPPRRVYAKRNSGVGPRPNPDGGAVAGSNDEKSLDEVRRLRTNAASKISSLDAKIECTKYEREMIELRRAMEALQMKLNRAEERLFGHDSPTAQVRREPEVFYSNGSPASPNNNSISGIIHNGGAPRERLSLKSADEESLEMDHLLQRLQSAEDEMRREQDLLTALDRKQKLIEVQEQKIARLDAVNNQLLDALAQIRDSLQQQQVQAQQQKVQMQLHKQQQQLQSLTAPQQANRNVPSSNLNMQQQQHYTVVVPQPPQHHPGYPPDVVFDYIGSHHQKPLGPPPPVARRTKGNNTTKVMITSDSSSENSSPMMSLDDTSYSSNSPEDCCNNGNRDSSTFLAENALKMLAELKSSSC